MIAFLHGKLARSLPNLLWIDVGGVGYEVHVPFGSFDGRLEGESIRVLTHLQVREDAHQLFGFATEEQRELFLLLVEHVTGIGPRLALAVLGGMKAEDFKSAVVQGDVSALARIKGVGKKTAERIVLELKDKVGVTEVWKMARAAGQSPADAAANDAVLAMLALGYKQVEAVKAVREAARQVQQRAEAPTSDALLRLALRALN